MSCLKSRARPQDVDGVQDIDRKSRNAIFRESFRKWTFLRSVFSTHTQRSTGYPSSGPDQITHGFKQLKHMSHRPHLVHPKMRGLEVFELSRFLFFCSTGNKDLTKNWLWTAFLSCCVLGESSSSQKESFKIWLLSDENMSIQWLHCFGEKVKLKSTAGGNGCSSEEVLLSNSVTGMSSATSWTGTTLSKNWKATSLLPKSHLCLLNIKDT